MNKEVTFTIPGKPIPLKRAGRHTSHCTYDPQRQQKEEVSFLIRKDLAKTTPHFDGSHLDGSHLEGPLHATFRFYFKLPKTKKLRDKKGLYHTQVPDLDNLVKFISDVMNNFIYKDDSQIFKISAIKCYTPNEPRTEITIEEIPQVGIISTTLVCTTKREKKNEKNKFITARKV